MAARDEILGLEQEISRCHKELGTLRGRLATIAKVTRDAQHDVEAAQTNLSHHEANVRHMKRVADVVALDEFRATMQSVSVASHHLAAAKAVLRDAENQRLAVEAAIAMIEKVLHACKKALGEYGEVIAFAR